MPVGQLLFGFEGRIRRSQFWLASFGISFALAAILLVLLLMMGFGYQAAGRTPSVGTGIAGMIGGLGIFALIVASFWVHVALVVKRWHDRDRPGVFMLFSFVPFVNIWAAIELLFLDGTQGPNQYGPSPKGITQVASVFA
jgi:uncharacterized membrane protein YhaH (DUF805 family)